MDSCAIRNDRRDDRLLERTRRGNDIARVDGSFGCFHVKTPLAVFFRTDLTSTPVRIGASIFSA